METEPVKKPFAFSVALRNITLGVTGQNETNFNIVNKNSDSDKPTFFLPSATSNGFSTKRSNVIPIKENNQRIPSKPTAVNQPHYRNKNNIKHSHRASNFYKARGYSVLLRSSNTVFTFPY